MAANLYAKSIFGEDALANLSIEKSSNQHDGSVTGHVRIRAKSQVINVCGIILRKQFMYLLVEILMYQVLIK